MLVGLYMLSSKRLRKMHPYPFIGWTCLVGGLYYLHQYSFFFLCTDSFFKVLSTTLFQNFTDYSYFPKILQLQKYVSISACLQHINMHMITLLDVFLVIRNPFYPNRKRYPVYFSYLLTSQLAITAGYFM